MRRRLAPGVLPMGRSHATPARRDATFVPFTADDATHRTALIEALAEHDEAILDAYVADATTLTPERLREQLGVQTRAGTLHPVFFGSAARGIGDRRPPRRHRRAARRRRAATPTRTSRAASSRSSGRHLASASRTCACSRARSGRASACGSGEGRRRSRPRSASSPRPAPRAGTCSTAGEMATVRGLGAVRVGDAVGEPPPGHDATARFPRPTLEAVVFARPAGGAGLAPRGPQPARRAGPAHRRPPGRRTGTRSPSRSTARSRRRSSRRRSSATTASPPTSARRRRCASSARRGVGEAEEIIRAKTKTNITGRSSPREHEPVHGHAGACASSRRRPGPASRSALDVEPRLVPLYLFKTPETFVDAADGVHPRGAGRGPGRLAGHRLPRHRDRLRLRVTGHARLPTTGG